MTEVNVKREGLRLGIVTVHNDPVPEMEIWNMCRVGDKYSHISIHTMRFYLPRQLGEIYKGTSLEELAQECGLEKALLNLKSMQVDAICLCFTSVSSLIGSGFDKKFKEYVKSLTGCHLVNTSAGALVEEIKERNQNNVSLFIPPWYSKETVNAFKQYLKESDIYVTGEIKYQLPEEWCSIPEQDRFDHGAVWCVSPDKILEEIEYYQMSKATEQVFVVPGSGFPSLFAEKKMGLNFVSANSATWSWFLRAAASI